MRRSRKRARRSSRRWQKQSARRADSQTAQTRAAQSQAAAGTRRGPSASPMPRIESPRSRGRLCACGKGLALLVAERRLEVQSAPMRKRYPPTHIQLVRLADGCLLHLSPRRSPTHHETLTTAHRSRRKPVGQEFGVNGGIANRNLALPVKFPSSYESRLRRNGDYAKPEHRPSPSSGTFPA